MAEYNFTPSCHHDTMFISQTFIIFYLFFYLFNYHTICIQNICVIVVDFKNYE